MTEHGVIARARARGRGIGEANPSLLLHGWPGDDHQKLTDQLKRVQGAFPDSVATLIGSMTKRRAAAVAGLPGSARRLRIRPLWRLVVGHGEESVLETGLTLSSVHGVPIIPGTALKGLAAAQARREKWPGLDRVFGSPRPRDPDDPGPPRDASQGTVRFFDALPAERPRLVLDVLTPHVVPYYNQANSGETVTEPPAEYHNPNPVRFLAVADTPFEAMLSCPDPADLDRVVELLQVALDEWGLGGKTAAGYGYCSLVVLPTGPGAA